MDRAEGKDENGTMDGPEKELLAAYRGGDTEALGKLVEHYRRPLFAFILKMTEGRDDAEEIFQETWFRAIDKLHRYRTGNFMAWIFRIAHNLVIDRARKKKPDASLQDAPDSEGQALEERVGARQLDPAQSVAAHDLGHHIEQLVEQLPPEQKEVFVMRTQAHIAFKEIARIQGVSINTALARMHYALGKLREELAGEYGPEGG